MPLSRHGWTKDVKPVHAERPPGLLPPPPVISSAITPRVVASVDQVGAALEALAPALRQYHESLVREGFTDPQAAALVVGYQEWLLG